MSETECFCAPQRRPEFLTGNCNYLGDMNVAGQTYAYSSVYRSIHWVKGCGSWCGVVKLAALINASSMR